MTATQAQDYFSSTEDRRLDFIHRHIPDAVKIVPVGEDWSTRRYDRITRSNGATRLLMYCTPAHITPPSAGHDFSDFIRIAEMLKKAGCRVPAIDACDHDHQYALIEDFGDLSMRQALDKGADEKQLYHRATEILIHLRETIKDNSLSLPDYWQSHIHQGRQRLIEWYLPTVRKQSNENGIVDDYLSVWNKIESGLPPCPTGFLHIDFHVDNLFVLPDGRLGMIDFQGAMWGPLAYDLVNLAEDIRRDIAPDTYAAIMHQYTNGMDDPEAFLTWVRVLGTQFHCRIAGQVIKLALISGKPSYLKFMPRVQRYLREGLSHPVLKPLKAFFADHHIDLDCEICPDRTFIRDDAF